MRNRWRVYVAGFSKIEQPAAAVQQFPKSHGGATYVDHYWNASAESFFSALAGVWNRWHDLFEHKMQVDIPDR